MIKMAKLGEKAKAYESKQTKNIADLPKVSVDLELEERTGKDKDGNNFDYNVIIIEDEEYRVPDSVLKSLKAILEENADLKTFKVKKTGQGLSTEYTVIPLG